VGEELKLQREIDKLFEWGDEWLVKINSSKCKAVSVWYRRSENVNIEYTMNSRLVNVNSFKGLGVTVDNHLMFDKHISEKINKAYSMLGIIKRNFKNVSVECFLSL